ncbi:hypothetical protein SAMN04487965_1487 [Microbulbifer donghaiensis]|uniref:Uncharacterized protein n=1 Tax=Microbulbifer donghaiensis TaxID=494016 RepID=A0A1M4ZB72_9GAMM|nr:hypothetical protein [Microbulbifer donghaiensis]SHF15022.1 hypothetical protein SAMN04487965_1487 [Microbulbifer donghaiensis]
MGSTIAKPFHRRQWLSVQQAVSHLSAVAEEPLTSADLADLAQEHQLDLYWYRPGQKLAFLDRPGTGELTEPLRLCAENHSDWSAIVDILRHRPALPAYEQDTPLLEDADGNRLRITFDYRQRPEPFSSRWYPNLAELVVKRSDLDQLEQRLFSGQEQDSELETRLLLNVIWQLEQLALDGNHHSTSWLADQLARRSGSMDRTALERVLVAAEREGVRGTPH